MHQSSTRSLGQESLYVDDGSKRGVRQCHLMWRRSPSTSPSHPRKRSRNMAHKSSSWSKGWKENTSWKPGTVDGATNKDSQSSQKKQRARESKKESRWTDVTKVFHDSGLHIKERNVSWHNCDRKKPEKR